MVVLGGRPPRTLGEPFVRFLGQWPPTCTSPLSASSVAFPRSSPELQLLDEAVSALHRQFWLRLDIIIVDACICFAIVKFILGGLPFAVIARRGFWVFAWEQPEVPSSTLHMYIECKCIVFL